VTDDDGATVTPIGDAKRRRKNRPVAAPGLLNLTDYGNAERFAAKYGPRVRFCPPRKRWYVWDGKRWAADATGVAMRLAKRVARSIYEEAARCANDEHRQAVAKHARDTEKVGRLQALLTLAETEPGIPVMPAELDSDPWLLTAENGTIDLRTGELRPHNPADLITRLAPVVYDPDAQSDLWERYLETVTNGDGDLAAYFRRVAGYAIQGTPTERKFFYLFGPPGTAKSTTIDAISAPLGEYAIATDASTWLDDPKNRGNRNRGDLVRLAGVRLATAPP